jgi:hypothetical protein
VRQQHTFIPWAAESIASGEIPRRRSRCWCWPPLMRPAAAAITFVQLLALLPAACSILGSAVGAATPTARPVLRGARHAAPALHQAVGDPPSGATRPSAPKQQAARRAGRRLQQFDVQLGAPPSAGAPGTELPQPPRTPWQPPPLQGPSQQGVAQVAGSSSPADLEAAIIDPNITRVRCSAFRQPRPAAHPAGPARLGTLRAPRPAALCRARPVPTLVRNHEPSHGGSMR